MALYDGVIFIVIGSVHSQTCNSTTIVTDFNTCTQLYGDPAQLQDVHTVCENVECYLQCITDAVGNCYMNDEFVSYNIPKEIVTTRALCSNLTFFYDGLLNNYCSLFNYTCLEEQNFTALTSELATINATTNSTQYKDAYCQLNTASLTCLDVQPNNDNCTTAMIDFFKDYYNTSHSYEECGQSETHPYFTTYSGALNCTATNSTNQTTPSNTTVDPSSTTTELTSQNSSTSAPSSSTMASSLQSSTMSNSTSSTMESSSQSSAMSTSTSSTMESSTQSSAMPNSTSSTMESSTQSSVMSSSTFSIMESSTQSSAMPSSTSNTMESSSQSSAMPNSTSSTMESSSQSSAMPSSTSNTMESSSQSSAMPNSSSSTMESSSQSSAISSSTSSLMESSSQSSAMPSSTSSTMESSTQSSVMSSSTSSTMESSSQSSAMPSSTSSTMESSTQSSVMSSSTSSTMESSSQSSAMSSTTSSVMESSTQSSAMPSSTFSTMESSSQSSTMSDSTSSSAQSTTQRPNQKCSRQQVTSNLESCNTISADQFSSSYEDTLTSFCENVECHIQCYTDAVGDCYLEDQAFFFDPVVYKVVMRAYCNKISATINAFTLCVMDDTTCLQTYLSSLSSIQTSAQTSNDYTTFADDYCSASSTYDSCVTFTPDETCTSSYATLRKYTQTVSVSYEKCSEQNHVYFSTYGSEVACGGCSITPHFLLLFVAILSFLQFNN